MTTIITIHGNGAILVVVGVVGELYFAERDNGKDAE